MATKVKTPTVAERLGYLATDDLIIDLHLIKTRLYAADSKIYKVDDTRIPDIISDLEGLADIARERAEKLKKQLHPLLYDRKV